MGKVVRTVLSIAAIAVNFIPGLGQLASLAISAALTVGSSLLAPKAKAPRNSPENLDRLRANVDPLTPRKTIVGYTAMATDIRDEEFTDDQTYFHRFIVCASHKVQAIEEVWFDDEIAWSSAGGVASKFSGYLTVTTRTEGSAANAINISSRMGTTRRYTGLAYIYLRYKLTGNSKKTDSPFAQSIPTRITIRGKAAFLPDPRNPAHDMSDQSTWTWDDNACRNPALALLFYLLGWRINGKLAVGKGIPPDRIDLDSFITAANICDELVAKPGGGTEPRYRCDGAWSEGDSPTTVIDMLKATMNADLDDVGGKLRLTVFHNDLATPVADFGDNDIIDAFTWQPLPPLDATFNVVRGLYTDPSNNSLYQQVDYPEQREDSPDGIDRIDTFNLPMVQSPGQAQRLAQLRLQRQKYAGVFEAEFQANAWKVTKNSVIRLTFGQTGFVSKFFRVAEMEIRQDGRVPMKLREEDPAIYGDPPLTGPITPIFSTPFDPANSPFVQAINRWQGLYSASTTYVLDDLVTASNGAAWRYINATPAAGQALPVSPATSNAYWELFTPVPDNVAPANANRVPFSRMEGDMGWKVAFNPSGMATSPAYGEFNGLRFYRANPTATASGQFMVISQAAGPSSAFRVQPGERLSVQALVDAFGPVGSWYLAIRFVRADATVDFVSVASGSGESFLNTVRSGFVDVPTGGSPVTGAYLEVAMESNAAGGITFAISEPMVTSAAAGQTVHPPFSPGPNAEDSADVTRSVSGPAEVVLDYTSTDTLVTPLPETALYSLTAAGIGALTSGVTWSVTVASGAFTGTAPSMVGTGSAELRINSGLSTAEATLQITASVSGRSYPPFAVKVRKNVLPATTSGGGGSTNIVSDNTLASVGTSGAFAAVSDDLTITLPSGVTSVTLTAASLTLRVAATLPEGATNSEFKWQRESSPGVWADVGGIASSGPSPTVFETVETGVRSSAGSVTCNRTASGLTAGSTQKFRLVGRYVSGNAKTTTVTGTVSAQT